MSVGLLDYSLGQARSFAVGARAGIDCLWLRLTSACLAVLLLISSDAIGNGQAPVNLSFSHILPDQLEAIGHMSDITMDTQGFMWFGGNSGLARFDGYKIVIYRHDGANPRSLSSNSVNRLLISQDGTLWIATESGLSRYHPETDDFSVYASPDSAPNKDALDSVRALLEDKHGRLWLGTNAGLLEFSRERQLFISHDKALNASGTATLWSLAQDRQGNLWLGSQTQGLVRYDPVAQTSRAFVHDPFKADSISHNDVRSVYIDKQNRLWAGTYSGVVELLQNDSGDFRHYRQPSENRSDVIWRILEDRQGNIWVGDGGGVNKLNPDEPLLTRFAYNEFEPSSPANFAVRCIYEDRAGDLWLGYFPSGVDRLDSQSSAFHNYRHNSSDPHSLSDGGVLATLEDQQRNLWVGTGFGLSYLDRKTNQFTRYFHQPDNTNSLSGNTSLSLALDKQGQLWVGSWSKGVNRINLATGKIDRYSYDPDDQTTLLGREPWRIMEDSRGDMWVATEMGISRYNAKTNNFSRFLPGNNQRSSESGLYSRVIYEDRQQNLWIGSDRGLFLLNRDTGQFTQYTHQQGDSNSLSDNLVLSIFEDRRGNLWLGTHAGGLNLLDRATGTFRVIGQRQGLIDEVISSITEDDAGNLWLTTQAGITQYNVDTQQFRNFDKRHGLLDNLFNRNTSLLTSWGELAFGSTKGLTLLDPRQLHINTYVPPVVLTDFQIFNRSVKPGAADSPLRSAISTATRISLDHTQSVFSIEFAALGYRQADQNQYAYRLEGFDQSWHQVGDRRTATYTNLNPGNYVFHVKASNNDGLWNDQGTSLKIAVLPAPWRTGWAYGLYVVLVGLFGAILVQTKVRKIELLQQKAVNHTLQKLDKIKDSFLANTSHELRTPLNGIIGLAESLIDTAAHKFDGETLGKLTMIRASGKRLANLVNDILDYSKMAEHNLDIKVHPVNTFTAVQEVVALLQGLAETKGLTLINNVDREAPWVMADDNRLQQILLNLLGNAIKYTEHGQVSITLNDAGKVLRFVINDTGMGIRAEDVDRLFIAFQQLDAEDDRIHSGTGLGLAISKQLVELQGGEIAVSSRFGEGSTFSFTLAKAEMANARPPVQTRPNRLTSASPIVPGPSPGAAIAPGAKSKFATPEALILRTDQFRLLIVDDDPVNRMVLGGILKLHQYQVTEASSGQQALDWLGKQPFDLIILDVMMPLLSGFETCKKLRITYPLEQLPVIFLTAKNMDDDLLKSFAAGGNDFLTKPVAKHELLARVANQLRLVEIYRGLTASKISCPSPMARVLP